MKIWFAASIVRNSRGGVNRSMRTLARALHDAGHITKVIYNDGHGILSWYPLFAFRLFLMILFMHRSRPDWVLARSTDGLFCALGTRLLKLKTKVAIYNHGWEEFVYDLEKRLPGFLLNPATTWKAHILRFPMLRLTLKYVSLCVSGTIHETRWLREKYSGYAGKFLYLPNGVNSTKKEWWSREKEVPPYFLFVGGTTWKKNPSYAVSLLSRILAREPAARLFCIGCEPHILCNAECENVGYAITCIPSVPMNEMALWYKKCPWYLLTSRYEGGHSLALLEALSSGAVAFVSPIPSNREIITHEKNGYLISCVNRGEDADFILRTMHHRETVQQVRSRAIATARRNRWERQAHRLERCLWTKR
ncbi:MAG: glycosyltransferase [Chitinivibrionales bacterium]|nr:glycosyltransferase [Chitinivibrionales bacterium]